jgi:hypothetical protein
MLRTGLAATVVLTVILILSLWIVTRAFGFHVSLFGSLALSIGLTILINVVLAVVKRSKRYY